MPRVTNAVTPPSSGDILKAHAVYICGVNITRSLSPVALLFVAYAFGCGNSAPPAVSAPPAPSSSSATTSVETSAPATPSTSASTPATTAASTSKPKSKGPYHWTDFSGPKVSTKITAERAWAVIPVGLDGDWGDAKLERLKFVRDEKDEQVFLRIGDEEIFVPSAMTHVAPPEPVSGLTKGTPMMVDVAASYGYARVTAITKSGDGSETLVKILYQWGSDGPPVEDELRLDQVIKLDDKLAFGQPIAFKADGAWKCGNVAYTDKDVTWAITPNGVATKVATADVKVIKVMKPLKKGEKVWGWESYKRKLTAGKIVEVIEAGVAYKVQFEGGDEDTTLGFSVVTTPL